MYSSNTKHFLKLFHCGSDESLDIIDVDRIEEVELRSCSVESRRIMCFVRMRKEIVKFVGLEYSFSMDPHNLRRETQLNNSAFLPSSPIRKSHFYHNNFSLYPPYPIMYTFGQTRNLESGIEDDSSVSHWPSYIACLIWENGNWDKPDVWLQFKRCYPSVYTLWF